MADPVKAPIIEQTGEIRVPIPKRAKTITLVECPRDAFQGLQHFIPTETKIAYLKALIDAGFTHIDFGSFVAPHAVSQMHDTELVWAGVREHKAGIYFIAIIANSRGLERAIKVGGIPAVGYPFSISETFQQNNTGRGIADSWKLVEQLYLRARMYRIELNVYLSMGFGNPYGEPWSVELVKQTAIRFRNMGITTVMLADTAGCAKPEQIKDTFAAVREKCPELKLGAHFHASPNHWKENVAAAIDAGCERLDSAMGGIGGCPFAQEALVGNVPTEGVLKVLREKGFTVPILEVKIPAIEKMSEEIYEKYH